MKKIIIYLLFIILIPLLPYGDENPDSLRIVIKKYKEAGQHDKLLHAMNKLSDHYTDVDVNFSVADSILDEGIKIASKYKLKEHEAEYYNQKGMIKAISGKYDEGLKFFFKSLILNEEIGNIEAQAQQLENIGIVYKDMVELKKAIEMQMKALKIREENGFNERVAGIYNNIAVLYGKLDMYDKREEFVRLALLKLSQVGARPSNQASIYNEAGNMYWRKGDNDSSKICYQKVVEISEELGWHIGIAAGNSNLGDLYREEEDYKNAVKYHEIAAEHEKKAGNIAGYALEAVYLSGTYAEMEKYSEAANWGHTALHIADSLELTSEKYNAHLALSNAYKGLDDYKNAFFHYKKSENIEDSLYSIEQKKHVTEVEAKYQNQIKQKEIEVLTAENSLNENRIKFGAVSIFLLLISGGLFYNFQKRKNIMSKNDLEQKLLRSQMNPHFIFNALAAIQSYIYKNEPKKAAGYLSSFSSLSRSVLTNSAKEFVTLEEEINMLKNYVELEALRMQGVFEYKFIYDEDEELEFINIPPMMVQPFIENAVKHGFSDMREGGKLTINYLIHESSVTVEVIDNGKGIEEGLKNKKESNHKSMAMEIFNKRRNLMQSKYKKSLTYEIIDRNKEGEKGTKIIINMPVIEE